MERVLESLRRPVLEYVGRIDRPNRMLETYRSCESRTKRKSILCVGRRLPPLEAGKSPPTAVANEPTLNTPHHRLEEADDDDDDGELSPRSELVSKVRDFV